MKIVIRYFILISMIIGHIFLLFKSYSRLFKVQFFNLGQKIFHSVMLFVIPFVWYYMIKDLLEHKLEVMTKEKRDKIRERNYSQFYDGGFSA